MKENEIRPSDVFNEYIRLSRIDGEKLLESSCLVEVSCVACDSSSKEKAFEKSGYEYSVCNDCGTLYLSSRPPKEALDDFYRDSLSSEYWANVFFPRVVESRRGKIIAPRAKRILDICHKNGLTDIDFLIDVGGGCGVFSEEWQKLMPATKIGIIEPSKDLASKARGKGFEVLQEVVESADSWHEKGDLVTCFEVIEHVHDPLSFVKSIFKLLKPGGYTVITGLGVEGFDIQTLWQHSKSVSPPHHINFMSVEGFEKLFNKAGFRSVQVITPGELDVDIVSNYMSNENCEIGLSRFEKLLMGKGEKVLKAFQQFLSENQLSSHCWMVAQK